MIPSHSLQTVNFDCLQSLQETVSNCVEPRASIVGSQQRGRHICEGCSWLGGELGLSVMGAISGSKEPIIDRTFVSTNPFADSDLPDPPCT
jgi:hypothetical protein